MTTAQNRRTTKQSIPDGTQTGSTVRIRNLTKRFGSVIALDDVNLEIRSGEFLTVLGPSGSGKTTILRLLAGFDTPTSGTIELDDEDVAWMPPGARDIGMVFQNYALFPHLTVEDNISYGLKMRRWDKASQRVRTEEMLRLVRLEGYGDRRIKQLSGGQQQRVAVARALAFGPRVLLMDEPLGALDKALRLEMGEEIRRIHRETNTTVIYVTHDQEEALALSDRVAIMRAGTLIACDTPESLYRNPPSEFVATFFGGCNVFPAVCTDVGEATARLECLGQSVTVPNSRDIRAGEGTIAVHPHQLKCSTEQIDDGHTLSLAAKVLETLFMGYSTQITCQVHGHGKVVVRDNAVTSAFLEPGAEVFVSGSGKDLVFLRKEDQRTG